MRSDDLRDDLAILQEKVAIHPDSLADICALADAYADRARWDDAVKAYEAAIALDPGDPGLHNDLGTVYEEAGEGELAEQAYLKAIALRPDYSNAHFNLGSLYKEQGRLPQAILAFEKCLSCATDAGERSDARDELRSIKQKQSQQGQVGEAASAVETRAEMRRKIRSWGGALLVLGGVHLLSAGFLSAPWGIVLLIVGGASFYFREASMFVIYSVTLAWAAITNLLAGEIYWIGFAIFQLYLVFQVLRQFLRFREAEGAYAAFRAEAAPDTPLDPGRARRIFPWAGGLLGALSLLGLLGLVASLIVLADSGDLAELSGLFGFLENLIVNLGILGLAVGLAALLSRYRHRRMAALGVVAGVLVLFVEFTPGVGERVFRATETALQPLQRSAAEMNLQSSDLGASFQLLAEDQPEAFKEDTRVRDGSGRLFLSDDILIMSTVILFRFSLSDSTAELRSAFEETIRADLTGQTLVFEPGSDIALGERGGMQEFYDHSAGKRGCLLFFIKRKALVTLVVYGDPEELVADDVQELARVVEKRIP